MVLFSLCSLNSQSKGKASGRLNLSHFLVLLLVKSENDGKEGRFGFLYGL
jgi:hypothetical protein